MVNIRSTRVVLITDRHIAYLRARHMQVGPPFVSVGSACLIGVLCAWIEQRWHSRLDRRAGHLGCPTLLSSTPRAAPAEPLHLQGQVAGAHHRAPKPERCAARVAGKRVGLLKLRQVWLVRLVRLQTGLLQPGSNTPRLRPTCSSLPAPPRLVPSLFPQATARR